MACGEQSRGPTRPQVFSSLFLAGKGLLAFQGLSRGDGLLNCRLSTRQGGSGRNGPCRPAGTVKSTLGPESAAAAFPVVHTGLH